MFVVDFASSVFFCFFLKKFSYLLSGFFRGTLLFSFCFIRTRPSPSAFHSEDLPGLQRLHGSERVLVEGGPAAGGAEASSLFSGLTCCFTCTAAAAAGPEAAAPPPPPPPAPPPLTSTGVEAASPEAGDADLGRVSVF